MKAPTIIWDLPTRVLHWSLATIVVLNLFLLDGGDPPHEWLGYGAVGFVALRGIWGFLGGTQSRFRAFPVRPRQVLQFLVGQLRGRTPDYPGHNPLASVAYLAIWLLILSLGLTGWMMELDAYWGEEWLEDLHDGLATAIQVLVVFHLVGMSLDAWKFKRRTWFGMIVGHRGERRPDV